MAEDGISEAELRNLPVPTRAQSERDRATVERGFWTKMRRFAGKIPFAEDAVAAFYCARDPATPWRVRATLLAALAYFIMPFDLIPDFVAGIGFTDDAAVLALAIRTVASHISEGHRVLARRWLERPETPPSA